jgi:hypothetical protein
MRALIIIAFEIAFLLVLLGAVLANPATVYLIHVHGPDNEQEIEINVAEISSIRQPREGSEGHFSEGVRCLVYMTNGKFISTAETCRELVKKIAALNEKREDK